jgi:glycosyltransferase involved in cell wall biosynthesis
MHIVLFTHPPFLGSQSMPRFANMLAVGMRDRGHEVEIWTAKPNFYDFNVPRGLKKWMGYVDQYFIFPFEVKSRLKKQDKSTLFVFTDHALGPWVPLVADRSHVIHCHDFLAQRSASNEIAENPTSYSGKKYQAYIRQGYQKGKNFISVSKKTKEDLHRFIKTTPLISEVVYNGLNTAFKPLDVDECRSAIGKAIGVDLSKGYILHVGGNQWYKNRVGVIEVYEAWRNANSGNIPLIMLGAVPNAKLNEKYSSSPYKGDIYLLTGKDDLFVHQAYSGAQAFLFPSLAEGFGWPIAEAMACGVPVITTGEAPMTEVGGDAAYYIEGKKNDDEKWAENAAQTLQTVLSLSIVEREQRIAVGIENCKRFNLTNALNQIENIYKQVAELA